MQNSLGLKLIAVMDLNTLNLYEAQGIKIIKKIGGFSINSDTNHRKEKRQGYHSNKSSPSSFFDPHTAAKDIEHQESSKSASAYIEKTFTSNPSYKELMIVSEPKMLGFIRQNLNKNIKKSIVKEIHKDLVHHNEHDIEKTVFS